MFSAGARDARPLKVKAAMVPRPAIRRRRRGGLIATQPPTRLAIFCQSFAGTSPAEAMNIGRRSTGGRRQVGAAKTIISAGQETACRPAPRTPAPNLL